MKQGTIRTVSTLDEWNNETESATKPTSDDCSNSSGDSTRSSQKLSASESKRLRKLRGLVFLVLFIAGTGAGCMVYFLTVAGEDHTFENTFLGLSEQLCYVIHEIVHEKVGGALGSLKAAYTSYAVDRNVTWPFVTLSEFQDHAAAVTSLSGGVRLMYFPIIQDDITRIQWEQSYSVEHGVAFMYVYKKLLLVLLLLLLL
jgi:hypothetical protein